MVVVAYHSTQMMGYEYVPTRGHSSFFSRKARSYLEKSIATCGPSPAHGIRRGG
jgi:hypothetical protein